MGEEWRMATATDARVLQALDGPPWDIDAYLKIGGYEAWKKCVKELSATDIVNELKKAGLRGRGGAGFPTGIKWEKVLNHRVKEHYFVCNAGEHEPGTFKDRYMLKHAPHQLIEGCLIGAYTVQAKAAFIYLKRHPGDYETVRRLLGHKSIRTTTLFYTGLEHRDAFTRFDAIIDSYMMPPKGVA
jgi:NADH-quinone oxidoreductase subunit F